MRYFMSASIFYYSISISVPQEYVSLQTGREQQNNFGDKLSYLIFADIFIYQVSISILVKVCWTFEFFIIMCLLKNIIKK